MDELYRQNAKIVYHFVYSLCHDKDLAQDLMQETFLQAYKSIDKYNGTCKISVWLCQIAKHLFYQYVQKNKNVVIMDVEEQDFFAKSGNTEQILIRYELMDVLKEMQKLPDKMREVMYLRIVGDLSFKEIGEILAKSENWCRVNFYRGKEILLKGVKKNE